MTDQTEKDIKEGREHQTIRIITISIVASCAAIVLACLFATTVVVVAFLQNPPW